MDLDSTAPLQASAEMALAEFTLGQDDSQVFILHKNLEANYAHRKLDYKQTEADMRATILYWRNWISRSTYKGRWREMVHRSALILKLLTFEPTGAIVAAVTTSLPEGIGGRGTGITAIPGSGMQLLPYMPL